MKASFFLVLMFLSFGAFAQSDNAFSTLDQDYEKINELRVQLFVAAYKEFGAKIRTAAILEACGKEDLATVVMPSDDELMRFLSEKIVQAGTKPSPAAEVLNRRNREMAFHLLKISYFQLIMYEQGYQDAVKTLKPQAPSVCVAAEELAKKLSPKSQ
ncbi:MAG: hypothetical protein Q7J84_17925 [Sulfuricaulis sp.]|nr:hypothetical protein [Sulfuricaulis sp.]